MQIPLTITNILIQKFSSQLSSNKLLSHLQDGNLYAYEQELHSTLMSLYDFISETLIRFVSKSELFLTRQKDLASKLGLRKLKKRNASVQLRTGTHVKYPSLYARKAPANYQGASRHLSALIWNINRKSSPMHSSILCLLSVLCPSFELSKNLLRYMGVRTNFNRVRDCSLSLAETCMKDRARNQIEQGETLANLRVSLSIDGGRSRTRLHEKDSENSHKNHDLRKRNFDTPWCEPKLFVISVIDENGKMSKERLPIYDSSFKDVDTVALAAEYLAALDIHKAKHVQIIGDGASWIWNRMKPMLLKLGVDETKITETLDYYHAVEHLNELKQYCPKENQNTFYEQCHYHLWKGNLSKMRKLVEKHIPDVVLADFTPWQYFEKHGLRIDYQSLKKRKMLKGSGIVESAIRRIINLRFKASSSFWYPENLEKLIYMRCIALAGRWEIMMKNITTSVQF